MSLLNNDLSSNVWVLMDPHADIPIKSGLTKVMSMSWEGYANADHHMMLKTGNGAIIFEAYGNTDLSPISKTFDNGLWLDDIRLVDLQSGRVLVVVG